MDVSLRWDTITRSGHLCPGCRHSHIHGGGQQTVTMCGKICHSAGGMEHITSPVEHCNDFYPRGLTSLDDMQRVAWELATDKDRKTIGFKPPKKSPDAGWVNDTSE